MPATRLITSHVLTEHAHEHLFFTVALVSRQSLLPKHDQQQETTSHKQAQDQEHKQGPHRRDQQEVIAANRTDKNKGEPVGTGTHTEMTLRLDDRWLTTPLLPYGRSWGCSSTLTPPPWHWQTSPASSGGPPRTGAWATASCAMWSAPGCWRMCWTCPGG